MSGNWRRNIGLMSAVSLADQGFRVDLIEKTGELGGHTRETYFDLIGDNPQAFAKSIIDKAQNNEKITIHLNSEVIGVSGYAGNYKSQINPRW